MKQLNIWMTDKQIEYVKAKSTLKKVSFDEMLRQIIEAHQKSEREEEVRVLKGVTK